MRQKLMTAMSVFFIGSSVLAANFQIERVEFQGNSHITRTALLTALNLELDTSVSKSQIINAVNRIRRLGDVLEAEFELQKGSKKSTNVLIVRVMEQTPINVSASTQWFRTENFLDDTAVDSLAVQSRWYLSEKTKIDIALQPGFNWFSDLEGPADQASLSVTQYGLFGNNIWMSAGFTFRGQTDFPLVSTLRERYEIEEEPSLEIEDDISPFFSAHFPIGDHVLGISSTSQSFESDILLFGNQQLTFGQRDTDTLTHKFFWDFDRTDDELMPSKGRLIHAEFEWREADTITDQYFFNGSGLPQTLAQAEWEEQRVLLWAEFRNYRQFGSRHSYYYGVQAGYGRSKSKRTALFATENPLHNFTNEDDVHDLGLMGGYAFDLFGTEQRSRFGRLRLEANALVGYSRENEVFGSDEDRTYQAEVRTTWRNRWGVMGLGFAYTDFE